MFIREDKMKIAIAGNKCDLSASEKKVSLLKLKQFAEPVTNCYGECSAKTGENVK